MFFNADTRKSNADIRRFIDKNICDHLRYLPAGQAGICENLRSIRISQRFLKRNLIPMGVIIIISFSFISNAEALSVRHHLLNATKNLVKMTVAPLKGVFITGPKNIKEAYTYEAYEAESPQEKSKLRGIWRAPGEEMKGALDGIVESVDYGRKFLWEIISIPWGD